MAVVYYTRISVCDFSSMLESNDFFYVPHLVVVLVVLVLSKLQSY